MNIIASAILAVAASLFTQKTKHHPGYEVQDDLECKITTVTNEPWASLFNSDRRITEMQRKLDELWAVHTNRIATIEARKKSAADHRSAIDRVKENVRKRKHKSGFGNSLPAGGTKK